MIDAHIDCESRSEVDLPSAGLDVYSRHPSTRILMVSWRVLDVMSTWTCEDGPPAPALLLLLLDPDIRKVAHNAQFERVMFTRVWGLDLPIAEWVCTMAHSYALGLPGSLAQLGDVLLLPEKMKKGKDGYRLMKLFSMPQRVTKKQPHRWRTAATDPQEWQRFIEYNISDVIAESFIAEQRFHLYPLPENEWAVWRLDQAINERGLPIDRLMVTNAVEMVRVETDKLMLELQEITGLTNPNSTVQLGGWLRAQGYTSDSLNKVKVEQALLDPDLTHLEPVLRLRSQLSRTAVKKYAAILEHVGPDDRLRYTFQFSGASRTGRWSGRGPQPQNLAKPSKELAPYSDDIIESVRANDSEWISQMYGDPMRALSGVVRGAIRAPEGHHLIVADLSSIESRVAGWLANCKAVLDVFHSKQDIYQAFATYLFHKPYDQISKAERNFAKPPVLGCFYGIGGGADEISKRTGEPVKTGLYGYASSMGIPLTKEESQYAVATFREAYKEVVDTWYAIENAAKEVITKGGQITVAQVTFDRTGPFLRARLPSGRALNYLRPSVEKRTTPWGSEKFMVCYEGAEPTESGGTFWGRTSTRGAKFFEQFCQAIANEILREGMTAADARGFHICAHSHDELVTCEPLSSPLTVQDLCDDMTPTLAWALDLPLAAVGYESVAYRKE